MSILLLAEHNNKNIQASTLNSITAAMEINDDLMNDWVKNERTLRFGSTKVSYSKDIKINSQEVKYFIDKVNEVKKSLGIN